MLSLLILPESLCVDDSLYAVRESLTQQKKSKMSTAIPMSGESLGVPFGFIRCDSQPSQSHETPTTQAASPAEKKSSAPAAQQVPMLNNRVAVVREQQGISQRTMARRLGIDLRAYQALEAPGNDLQLSQLVALQAALEVPLIDLLEDSQSLSRPVAERAKMIKVMKTAVALRETPTNVRIERMVQTLCTQLIEIMPELAEVSGWPQFGSRRGKAALGKALSQPISTADLGLPERP